MGNIVCAAPDKARKKRSKQAILLFSGDRKMAMNRTGQVWVTLPRDAVRQRKSSINRMAEQAAKYLITLERQAVKSSLWSRGALNGLTTMFGVENIAGYKEKLNMCGGIEGNLGKLRGL